MHSTHYGSVSDSAHSGHGDVFAQRRTLSVAIAVATCASMSIGIFPLVLGMFADRLVTIARTDRSTRYRHSGRFWNRWHLGAAFATRAALARIAVGGGLACSDPQRRDDVRRVAAGGDVPASPVRCCGRFRIWSCHLCRGKNAAPGASVWPHVYHRSRRLFGLRCSISALETTWGFAWALNSLGILFLISGSLSWWLPDHDRLSERAENAAPTPAGLPFCTRPRG